MTSQTSARSNSNTGVHCVHLFVFIIFCLFNRCLFMYLLMLLCSARKLGMDFDKALLGMQLRDAAALAKLVGRHKTLNRLTCVLRSLFSLRVVLLLHLIVCLVFVL